MNHFITNPTFGLVVALVGLLIRRGKDSLIVGYFGRPQNPDLLNVKKLCRFYGGALFLVAAVAVLAGTLFWISANASLYLYGWYTILGIAAAAVLYMNIVNPFIIKD